MRILLLWLTALTAAQAATGPPADLDAWIARSMQTFEVPGMAIAIVKDGKLVAARGYGVRHLGEASQVDEHTLFGIASNSKAFTSAAIAMLVDEGKLAWDDPVQKFLPAFQMADPYATRDLKIRDLLCHRSGLGLGAGDLLYWPDSDLTRDQVVAAVRFLPFATSIRSQYAYNNLMFVIAGQVVAAVTGRPWDDFIRDRIFSPLGMNESQISSLNFSAGDNVATPHSRGWRLAGNLKAIPQNRDAVWAAAAGIKASVADMAKWIALQLQHGDLGNGHRMWSEASSKQMWSAQTVIGIADPPAPLQATKAKFAAYGLGWSLRDYHGRKLVSHGGALTGMVSTVVLVPEENLGFVILTNQEESGAFLSIVYHLLDYYLELPPTDWIAAYQSARVAQLASAAEAEKKQAEQRVAGTKPTLPLASYAATYTDPWYGKAAIVESGGQLSLSFSHHSPATASLEHWHYDTFVAHFRDPTIPDAFVTFSLNRQGRIDLMTMAATSALADFSFDYQDLKFTPVRP